MAPPDRLSRPKKNSIDVREGSGPGSIEGIGTGMTRTLHLDVLSAEYSRPALWPMCLFE
jgi:hypothetical protein